MTDDRTGSAGAFRYAFENRSFREVLTFSREHLARIAYMEIDPLEGDRLHRIGMEGRTLGQVSASRMWCSPGRARRESSHVDMGGNENLLLVMPLSTPGVYSWSGGREVTCHPGQAFVWPGDEPASFAYGRDCTVLCVSLPRQRMAALEHRSMSVVSFTEANGLSLLARYGQMLINEDPVPSAPAALAGEHLRDLAVLALGAGPEGRDSAAAARRAARVSAIRADIAAHVTEPGFSLGWLARRHGLRPRQVRDLFYAEGTGFSELVLSTRLDRAHAALADPSSAGRNIAEIALDCGFSDISWFNRTFRRRFAMSPSETRELTRNSRKISTS